MTKLLVEEVESFLKTDDDGGRAEELQVDINLTDSAPIQRKYTAIRRPLYEEFKQYVEDMLNRRCIQSQSQLIHLRWYVFVKRWVIKTVHRLQTAELKNDSRQPSFVQGAGCPEKLWWESVVLLTRPRKGLASRFCKFFK